MENKIPLVVKEKAQELIEMYGDRVEYKGRYEEQDVYAFCFPPAMEVGFPHLFLYKRSDDTVEKLLGPAALKILHVIIEK